MESWLSCAKVLYRRGLVVLGAVLVSFLRRKQVIVIVHKVFQTSADMSRWLQNGVWMTRVLKRYPSVWVWVSGLLKKHAGQNDKIGSHTINLIKSMKYLQLDRFMVT
jgi:hypothetical protein